jgi:hypothetical protein
MTPPISEISNFPRTLLTIISCGDIIVNRVGQNAEKKNFSGAGVSHFRPNKGYILEEDLL